MKKTIISVITLILLCTMCIGFVACNEDIPTPPEPETISLFNFAKESTFSFGKFEMGESIGLGRRYEYGESYEASSSAVDPINEKYDVLLMQDDNIFQSTVAAMQTAFDKYSADVSNELTDSNREYAGLKSKEQNLIDHFERKKGAFDGGISIWGKSAAESLEQTEIGEGFHNNLWTVLKKEQRGDYVVGYMFRTILSERYNSTYSPTEKQFAHIEVEFSIHIYKKDTEGVTKMSVDLELIYTNETLSVIENTSDLEHLSICIYDYASIAHQAIEKATAEEKYAMGQGYFEAMEEVIDAWINDDRGLAYFNEHQGWKGV